MLQIEQRNALFGLRPEGYIAVVVLQVEDLRAVEAVGAVGRELQLHAAGAVR